GMHVPTAHVVAAHGQVPGDGHEPRSGLDQPPSHEQRLTKQVAAVLIAQPAWLAADVKRSAYFRGRQQGASPLLQEAEMVHGRRLVQLPPLTFKLFEQTYAPANAVQRQFGKRIEAG